MKTNITRREFAATATAAATFGGFSLPTPAGAQVPQVGKQAANFYRYKVGDFEVSVVADGVIRAKLPENFVVNIKPDDVQSGAEGEFPRPGDLQQHLHADRD